MALTNSQLVTELYIGYFNRAPDPVGLNFWTTSLGNQLSAGIPLATALQNIVDGNAALGIAGFSHSAEAQALYPFLALNAAPDPATAAGFVNAVYNNLLSRAPDAAGLTFWQTELDTGAVKPGDFILDIINSVNQQTGTPDAATLANKVTVADFYTTTVATLNAQFSVAAATTAISGVNGTPASVTAAETLITQTTAHMVFTLTAGQDTINDMSGIGHDIVNAPLVVGPLGLQTQSLNVGDTVNLTGPNNIVNIDLGGTIGPVWPAGSVINTGTGGTINIDNFGDILPIPGVFPALIPANDIMGATTLNDINSVADVDILGGALGVGTSGLMTVPTNVNMTNTGTSAFVVQVDTSVLTGTQSVALGLTGVGVLKPTSVEEAAENSVDGALVVGSNVPGTPGFSTFNMTITGNNSVALGSGGSTKLTALTITGTGSLNLDAALDVVGDKGKQFTAVKTIDATGVTGNVTISGAGGEVAGTGLTFGDVGFIGGTLAVGAGGLALTSVKTGAGNDSVDISAMSAANIAANALAVDLGAGTNTLIVSDDVAASGAPVTFFNNVQILGDANAGATPAAVVDTINMANFTEANGTVNEILFFGDAGAQKGAVAIINAQAGFTLDIGSADAGHHNDTITAAAAIAGTNATANVILGVNGSFDVLGGTGGEFDHSGLLTVNGFGTVNITSNGGPASLAVAGSHNHFDGILITNGVVGPITVNVGGNAELHVDTAAGAAGAFGSGFPIDPTAAVPVPGLVPAGNGFSLVELGNGTFFNDTDTAIVRLDGEVFVQNINASTSGGLVMDSFDTANLGTIGVIEVGSATAANFLAGSLGNDNITLGAGGSTYITEGGGDGIALGATHLGMDTVDLFLGYDTAHGNTPNYDNNFVQGDITHVTAAGGEMSVDVNPPVTNTLPGFAANTTTAAAAGDVLATQGFWGVAPGGTPIDLSKSGTFGTSADNSVVSGFHAGAAGDVIDLQVSAWLAGGTYGGLQNASATGTPVAGTDAIFEQVGPGAILGQAGNALATVTELGSGGTNGLVSPPEFANAAALANALQTDSYHLFTIKGTATGNSADFIVAYQNTAGNTVIADVNLVATNAGPAATDPGHNDIGLDSTVHVSDMVTLTGVALSTLNAHDIHFVA